MFTLIFTIACHFFFCMFVWKLRSKFSSEHSEHCTYHTIQPGKKSAVWYWNGDSATKEKKKSRKNSSPFDCCLYICEYKTVYFHINPLCFLQYTHTKTITLCYSIMWNLRGDKAWSIFFVVEKEPRGLVESCLSYIFQRRVPRRHGELDQLLAQPVCSTGSALQLTGQPKAAVSVCAVSAERVKYQCWEGSVSVHFLQMPLKKNPSSKTTLPLRLLLFTDLEWWMDHGDQLPACHTFFSCMSKETAQSKNPCKLLGPKATHSPPTFLTSSNLQSPGVPEVEMEVPLGGKKFKREGGVYNMCDSLHSTLLFTCIQSPIL